MELLYKGDAYIIYILSMKNVNQLSMEWEYLSLAIHQSLLTHSGSVCVTKASDYKDVTIHPGESITVSAVLTGWDYQTEPQVYIQSMLAFSHVKFSKSTAQLDSNSRNGHVISNSKECTTLNFTLFSNQTSQKE